jgi:hypothetical protein
MLHAGRMQRCAPMEPFLQAYEARYVPDVCHILLKWKPSSHNSVDFKLLPASHEVVAGNEDCEEALNAGQEYFLGVWSEGKVVLAYDLDHARLKKLGPQDPEEFSGIVIECNFDAGNHRWCFMRDRAKCVPCLSNNYWAIVAHIDSMVVCVLHGCFVWMQHILHHLVVQVQHDA